MTLIPIGDPSEQDWDVETWGEDEVPIKYDSKITFIDDQETSKNFFEKDIKLRIPNRYSLYDDIYKNGDPANNGDVEFLATGIFITPPDGMIYYTSDKELFKSGQAKTEGHYFYYDNDNNGFYETVYVLAPGKDEDINPPEIDLLDIDILSLSLQSYISSQNNFIPTYDVIAVGYNYDGIHDFVPYEKANLLYEPVIDEDFSQKIKKEENIFGNDWLYHFADLELIELLFPKEDINSDGYEPKDHIFEISKLVTSYGGGIVYESKYSQLFYEAKMRTFNKAWKIYKSQLERDIVDQVIMTTASATVSAVVNAYVTATIIASTLGWGTPAAIAAGHLAGTVAYVAVYSLLTKFNIDFKQHEAKSIERAFVFYPEGGREEPTSLNDRSSADAFFHDSMPAAIAGHPGAYYTTVRGGVVGNIYTAIAIASPPNYARLINPDNLIGMLSFLTSMDLDALTVNPNAMIGLDFDNMNLDYELLTTNLYSFNDREHYAYSSFPAQDFILNEYRKNTLGYIQKEIGIKTRGELNAIKPIVVDGVPEYIFIDKDTDNYQLTSPKYSYYQPLIINSSRYSKLADLSHTEGHLTVIAKCNYASNTEGIDVSELSDIERGLGYVAKIPLTDDEFYYPINSIEVEAVAKIHYSGHGSVTAERVFTSAVVRSQFYAVDSGNLYLTRNLECLLFSSEEIYNIITEDCSDSPIYYRIHINFARLIPDSGSEEHTRLALEQATVYTIMEFFSQYTFASTTANMIAEIGYTELMTIKSTTISAPLAMLGSYAATGITQFAMSASTNVVKTSVQNFIKAPITSILKGAYKLGVGTVLGAVKEAYEEIFLDGLIETFCESFTSSMGWNQEVGFWLSTLATSAREGIGGGGQVVNLDRLTSLGLTAGGNLDLRAMYGQQIAQSSLHESYVMFNTEVYERVQSIKGALSQLSSSKLADKAAWKDLLKSKIFKGIAMVAVGAGTFLTGNMNLLSAYTTLKSFFEFGSDVKEAAQTMSEFFTTRNIMRKQNIKISIQNLLKNLGSKMNKPPISGEELQAMFGEISGEGLPTITTLSHSADPKDTYSKTPVTTIVYQKIPFGGIRVGIADSIAALRDDIVEIPESAFEIKGENIEINLDNLDMIERIPSPDTSEGKSGEITPIELLISTTDWMVYLGSRIPKGLKTLIEFDIEDGTIIEYIPLESTVEEIVSKLGLKYRIEPEAISDIKYGGISIFSKDRRGQTLKEIIDDISPGKRFSIDFSTKRKMDKEILEFIDMYGSGTFAGSLGKDKLSQILSRAIFTEGKTEVYNFIQRFNTIKQIAISEIKKPSTLLGVFYEKAETRFKTEFMKQSIEVENLDKIISERWKKYETILLNDRDVSTRLLDKSMGNVILRGFLESAGYIIEDDGKTYFKGEEASLQDVFEKLYQEIYEDSDFMSAENLGKLKELWFKDSYSCLISSGSILNKKLTEYHSHINFASDFGEFATHFKFLPKIFVKILYDLYRLGDGFETKLIFREIQSHNLDEAYIDFLSKLSNKIRIADNGKTIFISDDGGWKQIIITPQKTSENIEDLLNDILVDTLTLIKLNGLDQLDLKSNPEVTTNVFIISGFYKEEGTKLDYLIKIFGTLRSISGIESFVNFKEKFEGDDKELIENAIINQLNQYIGDKTTKKDYITAFSQLMDDIENDGVNLDDWVKLMKENIVALRKVSFSADNIMEILNKIKTKISDLVVSMTDPENIGTEKYGIPRGYYIGYQFIGTKISESEIPNCPIYTGEGKSDRKTINNDEKFAKLQEYDSTFIHNIKTGETALILVDSYDITLPEGYRLGFYDISNKRILYGRYFSKRGGYKIINEINPDFTVKSDNYWRTELEAHKITTEIFDGDESHSDPIGIKIFIGQQYISRDHFYSYAETVNLIDPALAEGLSIDEGGWNYRPPIESQYFAGIATDGIKVKYKTRKGSDVSVRERVKPEIQMQTDILNYFINQIEEFSKGWYKSRESIDTCSELYRFLSNKYSDRDYNEEYFISQLKELGVSADDLEYINRYDVVDGQVVYGGSEHQDLKGFLNTFLQLIRKKVVKGSQDFDLNWANDPIFSTLAGDDKHFTFLDKPNKFTEKEAKLANSINAALMKIFGFTGLFMLRTGLLTFSIDSDGNYKYNNLIPKIKDLVRIFRNQKITGLNIMDAEIGGKNFPHGSYGADMFGSPDNRIQKLISCLLSGYRVSLELIDDQGKNLGKFFFVKNTPNFQYHEERFVNFDPNEANRNDIEAMVNAFIKGLYGKIPKVELFYDSCEIIIENLYKKVDWKIDHNVLEAIPGLTLEETEQKLKDVIRSGIWTLRCGSTTPRARIESLIKDQVAGQVETNIRYNEPGTGHPRVKLYTFLLYPDIDIDIYDNPRVHRFGRISDSISKEEWEKYVNMREGNT